MSAETKETRGQILVADDDPAILRLVKTVLEKEGFAVITTTDGREAYRLLISDEPFVAAIFDVMMPHITGVDLVKQMQKDGILRSIPVIIMTAEHSSLLGAESIRSGAICYLPKPFSISQIKNVAQAFIK